MDKWQSLLERFLRNECTVRENRIIYYVLRDGLINDELCRAIDAIISKQDSMENNYDRIPVPEDMLKIIHNGYDVNHTKTSQPTTTRHCRVVEDCFVAPPHDDELT